MMRRSSLLVAAALAMSATACVPAARATTNEPQSGYNPEHRYRSRWPGPKNPAGSKLARKAEKNRIKTLRAAERRERAKDV